MDWIDWKIWEENAVGEKRREGTRSPAGGRFTGLIRCRHQPNVLGSTALRAHLPSHAKSYDHGSTAQSAEPTVPCTRDSTNKRSQHVYGPIVTKYYNSYLPHAAIPTISTPLSIHLPPDDRQIRLSIPPDIRLFVTLPANAHLPPENEFPEW